MTGRFFSVSAWQAAAKCYTEPYRRRLAALEGKEGSSMYKITNFTTNDDIRTLGVIGPFTIVQYEREFSVAPQQAQFAWYCNVMNIRRRQVVCDLSKGAVVVQPGAMQWMAGDVHGTSGLKGVGDFIGKTIRSKMTGDPAVKPEYQGTGTLVLEPTYSYLAAIDVSQWGAGIVLDDGMFVAAEASLRQEVSMRRSLSSATLGNEGLFSLCLRGNGAAVVKVPCPQEELVEVELDNDVLRIDGNMAVAWSAGLQFTVEKATSSLMGSALSGEGLVNVYRGTGKVLLCPFQQEAGAMPVQPAAGQ